MSPSDASGRADTAQHAPQTGNTAVRAAFPGARTVILVGDHALSDRLLVQSMPIKLTSTPEERTDQLRQAIVGTAVDLAALGRGIADARRRTIEIVLDKGVCSINTGEAPPFVERKNPVYWKSY
jgi:hypothetical protein